MHLWSKRRALAAAICCIAAVFAFASCSDDDAVAPPLPPGPDLKIEADSMLVTVSWNPDFEVNKLMIAFQGELWFIYDESGLTPPIKFGETPPGAQTLVPTSPWSPTRPDLDRIVATLFRSTENGDRVVANGSRRGELWDVPTIEGEFVVYSALVNRISPPGHVPEVWEFTGFTAVPNAAWKDLSDDDEVETLLDVRPVIIRRLVRDENGVARFLDYEDLRVAEVDVDGETVSFIWDQIIP